MFSTWRLSSWRHVRCASKYATITIFKGICQFILMAAIKVNYSRRQNVQRERGWSWGWQWQWRQLQPQLQLGALDGSRHLAAAGSAQLGIIRLTCLGRRRLRLKLRGLSLAVFNFVNDIIAIDPIRIRLRQMSQNEYLVDDGPTEKCSASVQLPEMWYGYMALGFGCRSINSNGKAFKSASWLSAVNCSRT